MNRRGQTRRDLLKGGAAVAGLAAAGLGGVGVRSASAAEPPAAGSIPNPGLYDPEYTEKFWGEKSAHPDGRRSPLAAQNGILTPNRSTFITNHRNLTPNIDARQHTLLIHGMVDRPMTFTMEDLRRLPAVSRVHYVACAGQSYLGLGSRKNPGKTVDETHGGAFCSDWTGVLLSNLLEMVGVQKGANWMVAESADVKKHSMDIPMAKGFDDALLAYGQNGDLLNPGQGYPLRLLVPGFEGSRNIKWLQRIKVTDRPYFTYYENVAYHNLKTDGKARNFQCEMEPGGVITFPSGAQQLPGAGFYEIRGLAWSGGGSVHRVEVSVDGGQTWKDAKLNGPVHRKAFTMFTLPWKWDGKDAVLLSRTTDDTGDIQPALSELTKIWNVKPEYWTTSTNWIQHYNAIQPWRVDAQGLVTNGMFHPSNNT